MCIHVFVCDDRTTESSLILCVCLPRGREGGVLFHPNAAGKTLNACKLEAAAVSEQQEQLQTQLQLASATTSKAG